jgi:hypothetical protein
MILQYEETLLVSRWHLFVYDNSGNLRVGALLQTVFHTVFDRWDTGIFR